MKNKALKPLSYMELAVFCDEITMLLQAGIPLQEGLETIIEETSDPANKALLSGILDDYELNGNLSQAVKSSGVFPTYMVDQIEIASFTGDLQKTMESLSVYYRQEHTIYQSLRHAVRYPITMMGIMIVVLGVLLVEVLPIFAQVFEQMGMQLSGFNLVLLSIGSFISSNFILVLVLLALLIAAAVYFSVTVKGKRQFSAFMRKLPFSSTLYKNVAMARFVSAFSMLISSGIDMDTSLEKVEAMTDNDEVSAMVRECRVKILDGTPTHEALKTSGLLSGLYSQIASVGFKSGKAEQAMQEIAKQYSSKVTENIMNKISIIEPVMVSLFALVVGVILLSVMMPIFSVMSTLG